MTGFPGQLLSGNGTSPPIHTSFKTGELWYHPWQLGVMVVFSPGAILTATVQVSMDPPDLFQYWNNHDVLQNISASANSACAYPVTGLRLVVTNWSAGSAYLAVATWP